MPSSERQERIPAPLTHKVTRLAVAVAVGLAVALYAWHRATDPEPGMQRAREEAVVLEARNILARYVDPGSNLRIVDPVAPDRKVGRAYIYPSGTGWEVSGHYRRDDADRWHPFLMTLDHEARLLSLAVRDGSGRFTAEASEDTRFEATP